MAQFPFSTSALRVLCFRYYVSQFLKCELAWVYFESLQLILNGPTSQAFLPVSQFYLVVFIELFISRKKRSAPVQYHLGVRVSFGMIQNKARNWDVLLLTQVI